MKKFLFALFLGASLHLQAGDILANGGFNDGTAHWKGDIKEFPIEGAFINFQDRWTKTFQTFNTKEKSLDFSLTYKCSRDASFFKNNDPGPDSDLILDFLTGLHIVGDSSTISPGMALAFIFDPASNKVTYCSFEVALGSNAPQTVTAIIPGLVAHEEKVFYLAFPPGKGSVTLLHVSVTKGEAEAKPAP